MTLQTWERRTDWPFTAAAVVFLGCYAWPILQPDLDHTFAVAFSTVSISIWVAFAVDYATRVYLADDRRVYVRRHVVDVAMLVLPVLRPLRALRVLLALNTVNRSGTKTFRGRAAIYIAGAVPLLVFVAALAMLDTERSQSDANITSFGDAMWWAMSTMTTVGYGDRFPVTSQGRLIAVGLMIAGIALLGVVTAALASWFVERLGHVEAAERRTQSELDDVLVELRALRAQIAEQSTRAASHAP
jgi:voltage-gated potassium channel